MEKLARMTNFSKDILRVTFTGTSKLRTVKRDPF
jgi:hypothetical protein